MVQMSMPSLPIQRDQPGAGLLAHVVVSKYCDHLPLYRQSGIYAREGVELDRATLADWVGKMAALVFASGRGGRAARHGGREAACRRYAGAGSGAGKTKTGRPCAISRTSTSTHPVHPRIGRCA